MATSPAPTASTSAHMSSSSWENVQISTAQHTLPTPYRAALPPRPTPSAARDKWDVSPPVARDKWDVSPPVARDKWDLPPPAARESAIPSTSGRESARPAAASAATTPGQEVIVIEDSDDEDVGGYDVGDDGNNWGVGHTENEQVVPFGPSPPSSSGGGVSGVTPRDLFHSPGGEEEEEEEERGDTPAAVVPRGRAVVTQTARSPRTPAEAKNQHLKQWANKRKSLSGAGMQALSNGTRRSTRHRVRPLEYWRNEKVVYSRKYSSLPTLTHVEMHTPDPMWPAPAPKRRKEQIRLLKN